MKSTATTVEEYLDELPKDRREAIEAVREIILKNLPKGYQEVLQYGMLGYVVPLSAFPAGHLNRKNEPVPYVCLASQKNYMSIYLTTVGAPWIARGVSGDTEGEFRKQYKATGKKLDMGKSCIRFKKLDDLAQNVIAQTVAKWPMKKFIATCEKAWSGKRN